MSGGDPYDIRSHAVFEASAGTGKTYTVEQLVLRFLRNDVPLEQILIVTYTEKAAAELQDRLRLAIAKEQHHSESSETMAHALENYDNAAIFTIHAFCLRVLQQYPFDHRQNPRAQMTGDDEVMAACLREVQRGEWPAAYQKDLTSLLAAAKFNLDTGGAEWDEKVCRIASSFRPDCDHRLMPERKFEPKDLRELREDFAAELETISKLIGPCAKSLYEHPLYTGYGELDFNKSWRESRRRKYLVPLLAWATDPESKRDAVASFARMLNQSEGEDDFEILTRSAKQLNRACQSLPQIVEKVDAMRARLAQIEYVLATSTVKHLLKRMERYKLERGLHSFEDFLTRVSRALQPEFNPRADDLVRTLRKKYRIAIVDEFQDTDPLQWGIFKRLFVDNTDHHQLILVGDPKQAIYSFRNADVNTYLQAREELKARGTPVLPLKVSYRSCAPLVHGLNTLFRDGNFFAGHSGIAYEDVDPAPEKDRPQATIDQTGRKAITVVNFGPHEHGSQARRKLSQFIAEEIARLLRPKDGKPLLEFAKRSKPEALRADHIAVLLFKRSDSRWIEEQLRYRGVPYTFYKKTGIWQSEEAIHLNVILKALARTDQPELFRQMLLTRFFAVRPEHVTAFEHSAQTDVLHRLFLRWRELCDKRRWAELFRSVFEDTDTLCVEFSEFDGPRRIANYRYIAQELARAAYERGLSLFDVVELLQHKRLTSSEDESGLQPLETERPAVKLMTIHACKGLEFPVVFLAGGMTRRQSNSFLKYHDDNGRMIFNLDTSDEVGKERSKDEDRQEQHRLLYVALTRAMFKLYVPSIGKSQSTNGPIPEILAPALTVAKMDKCPHAAYIEPPHLTKLTATPGGRMALGTAVDAKEKIKLSEPLLPGFDLGKLAARRIELQSFSRLVQHTPVALEIPVLDKPPRADDDARPEEIFKDDLPPGASAGEVLHSVVETIDFASVRRAGSPADLLADRSESRELIEKSLRVFMPQSLSDPEVFTKRCKRIAELIWNALRTPLPQLNGDALAVLGPRQRIHELEFHMPFRLSAGKGLPDEVSAGDGFMTGFMDLVFTHQDRFYLLDWKSNALASYATAAIERDMDARHYHLQYRIYLQALLRWLKVSRQAANPTMLIGGVFYIYLRGMNAGDASRGVFFRQPDARDFDERALAEDLSQQAAGRFA